MITIEKVNESYIKVMGDYSEEANIKKFFTFKVPGYQFSPKFKSGVWNGDMSLYDARTKLLPGGLLNRLLDFIEQSDSQFEIRENDKYSFDLDDEDLTYEELKEWIDDLDITLPNNSAVRDYQIDAILNAIKEKKITLISPTSSGKSLIIYCLIRWMLDKNPHAKIILMVPTIQLVNQMFSDFQEYSVRNGFSVEKMAQKLFTGQPKELTKNILITTWQSLKNIANNPVVGNKVLAEYTTVIGDEAHTNKATECQNILSKCRNAAYRIGTTGTMDNKKIHQLQIEGMLGPVYRVISTKELMDTGQVSKLDLRCLVLDYPEEIRKEFKKASYQEEIEFLVTNHNRNKMICKLAMATTGTTLILTRLREKHAQPLYEMLSAMSERKVYFVSGKVKADVREEIRKIANIEDCIIVATTQTMATGVNIPNLRNVIFAMPSKDVITIAQAIGRGLRLFTGKLKMTLIDLIDDIRHKKTENFAYQHALDRIALYRQEQFDMSFTNIPFKP